MSGLWIGIDTGGTFTDLVLADTASGRYAYYKLPTSSDDPARAILEGVAELLAAVGAAPAQVSYLAHGTTLATNAVLEGKYARTGMITTRGFRDVLEIARQRRPSFFNLDVPKPQAPAQRDAIFEVGERLDERGNEVAPLDEAGVRDAVGVLRASGADAVAICFLHAYANPAPRGARQGTRPIRLAGCVCHDIRRGLERIPRIRAVCDDLHERQPDAGRRPISRPLRKRHREPRRRVPTARHAIERRRRFLRGDSARAGQHLLFGAGGRSHRRRRAGPAA